MRVGILGEDGQAKKKAIKRAFKRAIKRAFFFVLIGESSPAFIGFRYSAQEKYGRKIKRKKERRKRRKRRKNQSF